MGADAIAGRDPAASKDTVLTTAWVRGAGFYSPASRSATSVPAKARTLRVTNVSPWELHRGRDEHVRLGARHSAASHVSP
jgi:hypothetical protein